MKPRQQWEKWQREGRPTLGSRKPLVEYLVSHAQWHAEEAFVAEAKGQPVPAGCVEQLHATVSDLAQLVSERRAGGVEVSAWTVKGGAR